MPCGTTWAYSSGHSGHKRVQNPIAEIKLTLTVYRNIGMIGLLDSA
jgi:hypothetical protein